MDGGPTISDSIKWNNYPHPTPQSHDEGAKEQKRALLVSLKWGEGVVQIFHLFLSKIVAVEIKLGAFSIFSGVLWTMKMYSLIFPLFLQC